MSEALVVPYENATQMRDHWWWRPGWRPGRRFYGVFATFEDQPALHRVIDEWQQRLATVPDLDMVPTPWRHLTIQGIGFTDEVTDDQLSMITTSVEQALSSVPAPWVRFGPLAIHREALALPAIPQEPFQLVRDAIRSAIAFVLGRERVDGAAEGYRSHVTVAYNAQDRGSTPAEIAAIADSPVGVADVTVSGATLIELNRDHRMYQWQPLREIIFAPRNE